PMDQLRIVVGLRLHLRVEASAAQPGDRVAVLDEKGAPLMINVFRGRSRNTTEDVELKEGRSDTLAVPDTATTLVLKRGETIVSRTPLALTAGEVNVVRL